MALSATFTANFSSFYDAVDKAEVKLKDFGAGADKVGGRLTALGNSFSGVKIIQDATLMVKAVEDIGGASKLTEKELARLGATTNEAVAKMKALGMDVPKNLQDIADKTKQADKATTDWKGSLTKIAATLGIAFSVDAIKGFIASVFDAAGAIQDLSNQWGVSTKFVQQWTAAAKESGIEADQIGKSIQFMTEKLSESSPEYVALLRNIGLSADAIRKMSTEEAYKVIVQKIAGIKDETLQLDIAMGVLGPNAKKIIGGIRDGLYEAADAQKFMSDETIKRLDKAGDAWAKFKNEIIIHSGEILASVQKTSESSAGAFGQFLVEAAKGYGKLTGYVAKVGKDIELAVPPAAKLNATLKTTAQVEAELKKKTDDLAAAERARTQVQQNAKKAQEDWNKRLQDEYNAVIDLKDQFSGAGLISKALQYVAALKTAIPIQKMTAEQQANINKVMEDALAVYAAAGTEAPQAMYDIWAATVKTDEEIVQMAGDLASLAPIVSGLPKFDMGEPVKLTEPIKDVQTYDKSLRNLSTTLGQLGRLTGGTFGEIVSGAADVAGGMDLASRSAEDFRKGLAALQTEGGFTVDNLARTATGAIGMATAFIAATHEVSLFQAGVQGAMIGLAVGGPFAAYTAAAGFAIGTMVAYFQQSADLTGKEVRKLRQDAIDAAGGYELLASRAETAGVSLINLSMAYEDPAKLKAALDEINAAFKYQDDALKLLTATAEHYGFTLEELGPAMQRNELEKQAEQLYQDFKLLTSAGIDQVLVTEKMADSVNEYVQTALKMGVEIPSAMKPMLESFAKSGELVDENGNAITDLEKAGISFSLTMSDGFKVLINEVQKLTDVISRSLGTAIKDIPQPAIVGRVSWEVDDVPVAHGGTGENAKPLESFQGGTEGFRNFGKGTPVMLHGWEAVVPREDAGAFATVAPGGGRTPAAAATSIVINAQGAFFDTPGDLQRLADKVNDALTAKYGLRNAMRAG